MMPGLAIAQRSGKRTWLVHWVKAPYQGRVCQSIHCGAADGHGGQLLHCVAEGTHSLLQAWPHLCLVLSHLQGMLASTLDFRVAELLCGMRQAVIARLSIILGLARPLKRNCMALRLISTKVWCWQILP